MSALVLCLWFLIWWCPFWQGLSLCPCPSLRLIFWAVWQSVLPPSTRQLWGDLLMVFKPRFFLMREVGQSESACFCGLVLQSSLVRNWYVSLPAPSSHRASLELSFLVDHFSLGRLLVSAHYQFLQDGQICHFPQAAAGPPHSHQARVKFSFHLLGHLLCPGGVQFVHKLSWTMSFPPATGEASWPGGVVISLNGTLESSLVGSGRQQLEVPCPWILVGSGYPKCLYNLFLPFFVLSFCSLEREKKKPAGRLTNLGFQGCYML
jgi:hypothetical protein